LCSFPKGDRTENPPEEAVALATLVVERLECPYTLVVAAIGIASPKTSPRTRRHLSARAVERWANSSPRNNNI
jgi:hypothetical protein